MDFTDETEEDLLIIDELDLEDESELRRIVTVVESLARSSDTPGLRVSVLTPEQWESALNKTLPPAMRRGAAHLDIHVLRDSKDLQHLLVSPAAVRGVNESSSMMLQNVVYAALRCLPVELPILLRRGLDDLIAAEVSTRAKINLFTKNYPRESALVSKIVGALSDEYSYQPIEWAVEMRRGPKRVIRAFARTEVASRWAALTESNPSEVTSLLSNPELSFEDPALKSLEVALDER